MTSKASSFYPPTSVSDQGLSSSFKARTHSSTGPVHSTAAAQQTTPDYRQKKPNFFATIPIVPGVRFISLH